MVVQAYRSFASPDQLTEENLRLARILAWCMELVISFLPFLIYIILEF